MSLAQVRLPRFEHVFKKTVRTSAVQCWQMQIVHWDFFFFSFILQKWVSEITRIERSARCVFSHLFRFHKANFGKRIDFSFRKKLC